MYGQNELATLPAEHGETKAITLLATSDTKYTPFFEYRKLCARPVVVVHKIERVPLRGVPVGPVPGWLEGGKAGKNRTMRGASKSEVAKERQTVVVSAVLFS